MMKAKRTLLFAFLIFILSAGCGSKPYEPVPTLNISGPEISPAEFFSITAETIVETLSDVECRGRYAGSEENAEAGEYLADLFSEIGLEPLSGDSYLRPYTQATCDPLLANPRLTLYFTDGSSRELIYGEEFYVPTDGSAVDLRLKPNGEIENGKIFTVPDLEGVKGEIQFISEKTFLINNNMLNRAEDVFYIEETAYGQIEWDAVSEAALKIEETATQQTLYNIAGKIPGRDSGKAVIISAHFDGVGAAGETVILSAVDNVSGVAAMLCAAQALGQKREELEADVIILAANGEETSLEGSQAFAAEIASEYEELININLDCIGTVRHGDAALSLHSQYASISGTLNEAMRSFLSENQISTEYGEYYSDHRSFESENIPALGLFQANWQDFAHTVNDTPDALDFSYIDMIGSLTAEFILSSGGEMYAPEISEDEAWEIAKAQAAVIREKYDLAFDEAYAFQVGSYYFTATGNATFAPGDHLFWYPDMNPPEIIGDFHLDSIWVRRGWTGELVQNMGYIPDVVGEVYKIDVSVQATTCTYVSASGEHMVIIAEGSIPFPPNLIDDTVHLDEVPGNENYYCYGYTPEEHLRLYYEGSSFYIEAYRYRPEEYVEQYDFYPQKVMNIDEIKELIHMLDIPAHLDEYRSLLPEGSEGEKNS